ncbi:MAG: LacI family DNA-binding transcriptional regulator [Lachnospiraceae bacterium]|nr:LacI family DNA-binding transcriptional regulator [Lachnospiraceae bacterium]
MNHTTEGKQNINISDIAAALGVSKTTVSRAISGKGRIGAETRAKVMDYIEEHNYRPNVLARGLASSKTYNIALMLPAEFSRFEQPFSRESLSGVYKTAVKCDYDVVIAIAQPNNIDPIRRIVENGKVDGFILFQATENDAVIPYLQEQGVPFVLMGSCDDSRVIQVDNRQMAACQELTTILLLQGIKKIALLGGNMLNQVNKSRYEGFCKACDNLGCKRDKNLIFTGLENDILIARAAADVIANGAECIVCMDDIVCAEVLKYIEKTEHCIPEDIKVASFYDNQALREYLVSITALHFDAEELGSVACRQLLDLLDGRAVEHKIELGYQVVLRESTKLT